MITTCLRELPDLAPFTVLKPHTAAWASGFGFVQSARGLVECAPEVLWIDDGLRAGEAPLLTVAVDGDVLQRFRQRVRRQWRRVGLTLAGVPGRAFADALEARGGRPGLGGHERRAHLAFVFEAASRILVDGRRQR